MNKSRMLIVLMILFIFGYCIDVSAASASLSVSSSSVYAGDSFTVFVNMNEAAAWNIHVSSSGPVSGCTINEADSSSNALNISRQFSAKCTSTKEGKIQISLSGDLTSAPNGNYSSISGSTTVNVVTRPQQNQGGTNNKNSKSNDIKKEYNNDGKSENTNLKSISVDGYKVEKVDANNYKLTVPNSIDEIKVNAIAEDNKANVTGVGNHKLKIGENNIEIEIISESGKKNKVILNVTRKDKIGIEELDELLKNSNKTIKIDIDSNTNLSSQQLSKIKSSGKIVILDYKENGILKYSWIINGKKINDFDELLAGVKFNSKNKKRISKLSNYAEGIYLSFKQSSPFPNGTKLRVYVKDKYSNGDKVNIYYYDGKKMVLHRRSLKVKDGYVVFDVDKGYDHFITMSSLRLSEQKVAQESTSLMIPMIILFVGLLFLGIVLLIVRKNQITKKEELVDEEIL